jgi:hypothetical protein
MSSFAARERAEAMAWSERWSEVLRMVLLVERVVLRAVRFASSACRAW